MTSWRPKQLHEMNCLEALAALREGLRDIEDRTNRLPEISLIETFIDRAVNQHIEEVQMAAVKAKNELLGEMTKMLGAECWGTGKTQKK